MYITFNNETKKVDYIGEKKPASYTDNLTLAEVKTLPEKYDYLTIDNVREETDTWTEKIEDYNEETGEVVEKEVEKSRTYTTCDLKACFNFKPTAEQLEQFKEKQKEKRYKELTSKLIRQRYSQDDVEALLANHAENKEKYQVEFDAFAAYRKECKAKARLEVYGS
jgi:hypothetical protein